MTDVTISPEPETTRQITLPPMPMQALTELCKRYQVAELSLFGSAVRGELRPDSDFDFLVMFQPQAHIGFLEFSHMTIELSELLGRPVDLVPKDGLKPFIRAAVLAEARVLYEA